MLMYREDYYDKETAERDDGNSCGEASEWACGDF